MKTLYSNDTYTYRLCSKEELLENSQFVDDITEIIEKSFSEEVKGSGANTKKILARYEHIVITFVKATNEIVGYCFLRFHKDLSLLNYSGLSVHPSHAGKMIGFKLAKISWQMFKAKHISFTTQNPKIYQLYKLIGFKLYPHDFEIDISVDKTVSFLTKDAGRFCRKRLVFFDKYDKCLYDSIPVSKDKKIDEYFSNGLKFDDNRQSRNAFLVIGVPSKKMKKAN